MDYIRSLCGAPYVWWTEGTTLGGDTAPFWNSNTPPPSSNRIHAEGLNCAGFINLICRNCGIPIPGLEEGDFYAGGTWFWFQFLHSQNALVPIENWEKLESGTLLLKDYESVDYQGHVGIVVGNKFAHCIPERGVVFDDLSKIPEYFTHAVDRFFPLSCV